MLIKYLLLLIYCVYDVFSLSNFIEKGRRPEIFELTDNEVVTFRVTIPDNEFSKIKEKVIENDFYENTIVSLKFTIESFFMGLKGLNFTEVFPGYDFNMILPELKIDESGYSKINFKELLKGFDFNPEHYDYEDVTSTGIQLLMSNSEIDTLNIIITLSNLNINENAQIESHTANILYDLKSFVSDLNSFPKEKRSTDDNKTSYEIDYTKYTVKNANLKVEINGEEKVFNKVTLKTAGHNSLHYAKPGFNIKIGGGKDLYGCNQFKIRSESSEPTVLRRKLVSDIHHHLGIPTVSTNFITLYINDEYLGLYTINEPLKLSWIKNVYGEENTTSLYQCDNLLNFKSVYSIGCTNENENVNEDESNKILEEFLEKIETAKSASDLEDIFEIDHFLTEIAIDLLTGSFDHIQSPTIYHNFSFYKQKNGKWVYIPYDFDLDMGILASNSILDSLYYDTLRSNNLLETLIWKDSSRFDKILKEVVNKVFNPATLYPHINELKQLIKPYVELDKTPDANGQYPGYLNYLSPIFYSYEEWDANSEFTSVNTMYIRTFGLKHWILLRYRFICNQYHMECDPIYMDENYEFPINKNVEVIRDINDLFPPEEITPVLPTIPTITNTTTITTITTPSSSSSSSSPSTITSKKCLSEFIGYECCSPDITSVYARDDYGDWSYDFNKNEWCGLTTIEEETNNDGECWSEAFGYPCCKTCVVYEEDSEGSWGYESNEWCGTPLYCNK